MPRDETPPFRAPSRNRLLNSLSMEEPSRLLPDLIAVSSVPVERDTSRALQAPRQFPRMDASAVTGSWWV